MTTDKGVNHFEFNCDVDGCDIRHVKEISMTTTTEREGGSTMEKLDEIVEKVEREFAARIDDLNNDQVRYVVEAIIQRFEGHLNRLDAGAR